MKEQLIEIENDVDEDEGLALIACNMGLQAAVGGRVGLGLLNMEER
jgi:hypothetical protein